MKTKNEKEIFDLLNYEHSIVDDGFSDSVMKQVSNENTLLSLQKIQTYRIWVLTIAVLISGIIFGAGNIAIDMVIERIEIIAVFLSVFFVSFVWLMSTE